MEKSNKKFLKGEKIRTQSKGKITSKTSKSESKRGNTDV